MSARQSVPAASASPARTWRDPTSVAAPPAPSLTPPTHKPASVSRPVRRTATVLATPSAVLASSVSVPSPTRGLTVKVSDYNVSLLLLCCAKYGHQCYADITLIDLCARSLCQHLLCRQLAVHPGQRPAKVYVSPGLPACWSRKARMY